jgi:hypothetical protein
VVPVPLGCLAHLGYLARLEPRAGLGCHQLARNQDGNENISWLISSLRCFDHALLTTDHVSRTAAALI